MNQFNGIGNLVREVDLKKTQTGKSVASFTLAINRYGDEVGLLRFCSLGTKSRCIGEIYNQRYENRSNWKCAKAQL